MNSVRGYCIDALCIALAWCAVALPLPPAFVEGVYANGLFARMNETFVPAVNALPFALGDLEILLAAGGLLLWWVAALRRAPRGKRRARALTMLAHTAGCAAVALVLFEVLWGWNYRRETVASRVAFDPARVTPAAVAAFGSRIVATLNADVGAAHTETLDRSKLADAFEPVAARLGDRWNVAVTVPKTAFVQAYYEAAGVGGQYSPLSFETLLNASFLPFEVPRALAHEWSHAGGFTNEGDANYIATVACLRSSDPLIRYSGAFWTFGELPPDVQRAAQLDPRVRADFEASRQRFMRHYLPQVFALQWRFYDGYLRANNVAGGVASYGFFLQLLVGAPLDPAGLPELRSRA